MRDCPIGTPMPLRNHGIGHLIRDGDRTGPGSADHLRGLRDVTLLLVDPRHQVLEPALIEPATGFALERCNQLAHLLHQQLDPLALEHLSQDSFECRNHCGSLCVQPGASRAKNSVESASAH